MLKRSRFRVYVVCLLAMTMLLLPCSLAAGQNVINDDELVVTNLDDQSGIAGIQVLDNLRIPAGTSAEVKDGMNFNLTSVRNLYSSEAITKQSGYVGVNVGNGGTLKDLYYLATLDKSEFAKVKYPVSVKVEYYLDGKQMPAGKLAGKSGHLKIVCYLENLTKETKVLEYKDKKGNDAKVETDVYTPYVVSLSGWEFDNKLFSNVKAPGVSQVSPQGVPVNIQGITSVSWSVPLVPPKYPAKQYTVVEADAKNIKLPSFKIAVIPILPTTSEIDNLQTFQDSFSKLYDGFDQIQQGVGERSQNATLLFGLGKIKDGMGTLSSGLGGLSDNLMKIRVGLSNPKFDAKTYNQATGVDGSGNKPGLKDGISLLKAGIQDQAMAAYGLQKSFLGMLDVSVGHAGEAVTEPTVTTSLYNDIAYLKGQVGAPQQKIITDNIEPKLARLSSNIITIRDGGNFSNGAGSMPFPASIKKLEEGSQTMMEKLATMEAGLGPAIVGLGMLDANGDPMKVMANGKPASILYALDYMKANIDGQVVPGLTQLSEGAGKIATGAGGAKNALATGMVSLESRFSLTDALGQNAAKADTFLGKPEGATGNVVYVFQTPEVDPQNNAVKYGAGLIILALIVLVAIGRAPKEMFQAPVENQA